MIKCCIIDIEIPHFVRNDASTYVSIGEVIGGFAADYFSPPLFADACHSERSEESHFHK